VETLDLRLCAPVLYSTGWRANVNLQYAESTELFCDIFSAEHYLDITTLDPFTVLASGAFFAIVNPNAIAT